MKKTILSLTALLLFTICSHAQSLNLGLKLGTLETKVDGQSFNSGFKLSYQGGAFAEIDLLNKIGIQPELLFSQTSSKTVSGPVDSLHPNVLLSGLNANTAFTLDYLSIPVLLRYNLLKVLTINLGPQFGILLNKNTSLLQNGKNAFKSGDVTGVVGLQVHLSSLRVYGRYVFGLNNINNISSVSGLTTAANVGSWKNQQVELGVGLKVF